MCGGGVWCGDEGCACVLALVRVCVCYEVMKIAEIRSILDIVG